LLPQRGDSDSSWTIDFTARKANAAEEANTFKAKPTDIENAVYDLKAVNPNKKQIIDSRTPDENLK